MSDELKCWVCSRTTSDVRSALEHQESEEMHLREMLSQVAHVKSKFVNSSRLWEHNLPVELREMDLLFVIANRKQFESFKMVEGVLETKILLDKLCECLQDVHKGEHASLGFVTLPSSNSEDREFLMAELAHLEEMTHRRLCGGDDSRGDWDSHGLQGLTMAEGLDYLRTVGTYYFEVQTKMLERELTGVMSKRSHWGVNLFRIEGFPQIPLCHVCETLLSKRNLAKEMVAVPLRPTISPTISHNQSKAGWKSGKLGALLTLAALTEFTLVATFFLFLAY